MSRELDRYIAEHVMEHEVVWLGGDPNAEGWQEGRPLGNGEYDTRNLAHYSTDFVAAAEILAHPKWDQVCLTFNETFGGTGDPGFWG